MAVFWCTEALPLAVTAMLPVCLFPTLGILPSKKVCIQYFLETNFLFLSGLLMASSIEEWGLHRRIALKVLSFVGLQPARCVSVALQMLRSPKLLYVVYVIVARVDLWMTTGPFIISSTTLTRIG